MPNRTKRLSPYAIRGVLARCSANDKSFAGIQLGCVMARIDNISTNHTAHSGKDASGGHSRDQLRMCHYPRLTTPASRISYGHIVNVRVTLGSMKRREIASPLGIGESNYRYRLTRRWGYGSALAVVGLNPSTANRYRDDATTRRITGLAKELGHSRFVLVNLYGYRSTDPRGLLAAVDPIGPGNDAAIVRAASESDQILLAWGSSGQRLLNFSDRVEAVTQMLTGYDLWSQGVTKGGHPRHPLYNSAAVRPYNPMS